MFRLACLAAALLAAVLLGSCASIGDSEITRTRAEEPPPRPAAQPAPPPEPVARPAPASRNDDRAAPPRAAVAARLGGGGGAVAAAGGAHADSARIGAAAAARPNAGRRAGARGEIVAAMERGLEPAMEGPMGAAGSPALRADQERMHQRDAYINGLKKGAYTFNPPSPIKVAQPITVALWVDPAKEAAQLAEEMKRAIPGAAARIESGTTTWSPRMRATLTGVDFEITPVERKDFAGEKDLSLTGRTEWGWTIVPTSPGKKQLLLLLSVVLPPELGEPRQLPVINRDIEVEVTVWWLIDHFWEKYWKWMIGGLASAAGAAIAYWWKSRRRRGK